MSKPIKVVLVGVFAMFTVMAISAAPISWSGLFTITGDTDVATNGTTVFAYDWRVASGCTAFQILPSCGVLRIPSRKFSGLPPFGCGHHPLELFMRCVLILMCRLGLHDDSTNNRRTFYRGDCY